MAKTYEMVTPHSSDAELSKIAVKDVMPTQRVVSISEIREIIATMENDIKAILQARNILITELDEMSKAFSLTIGTIPELTEEDFSSIPKKQKP